MTNNYNKQKEDRIANNVSTRAMPSNDVLELEALARLLDSPSYIYDEHMSQLTEEEFHEFQEVFTVIKARALENKSTSIGIINSYLQGIGRPVLSEEVEDRLESSDSRSDTYELVKELKKLSKSRQFVTLGGDLQRYGFAQKPKRAGGKLDDFILQRNREENIDRNKSGIILEDEMSDYLFNEQTFSVVPMFGKTLNDTIGGFPLGVVSTVLARPSMGKALEDNEKVLTNLGWVAISKLDPRKHRAFGSDGKTHEIKGVYPQGEKDIYTVSFDDGTSIKACGEHLWTVIKDDAVNMQTLTTLELIKKIQLRGRTFKLPPAPVIVKQRKLLPLYLSHYLLGAFVGRGNIENSDGDYSFYSMRLEVMQQLSKTLEIHGGELAVTYSVKHGKRLYKLIASKDNRFIQALLQHYSIKDNEPVYPIKKRILKDMLEATFEDRVSFIRGTVDMAGRWVKGGMIYVDTPRTENGKEGIELYTEVVRSCGFKVTIRKDGECSIHQCWHDGRAKQGPPRLFEYCLAIRRKTYEYTAMIQNSSYRDSSKSYPYRKQIVGITAAGCASCTCIAVSALDSLFVADGYCLTHNTRFLLASALYAAKWAEKTAPGRYFVKYLSQDGSPKSIVSGYCVARYGYELKAWFKGIKEGTIPQNIIGMVRKDMKYISTLPLSFNDESKVTPIRMTGILQRYSDKTGRVPLLVIGDYLQSYHPNEGTKYGSRTERIAITMEQFYEATRQANSYALCMATQLPKEVDQRADKRPQMGDGKGASEIEEKSEVMVGLYRESYYTKKEDNTGEILGLKIKTGEKNTTVTMGFQHGLWVPRGGYSSYVQGAEDIHSIYSPEQVHYASDDDGDVLV